MSLTATDALLLASDWVDAIERVAALTTDERERAELDRRLDVALEILEQAHAEAAAEGERQAVMAGPSWLISSDFLFALI